MSEPSLPPVVRQPIATTMETRAKSDGDLGNESASSDGVLSNRPLIFGILFGVTGALGLPLLWYSPAFTRQEKWLWSIVNFLYTLGLIAIAIASLKVIFEAFSQLN